MMRRIAIGLAAAVIAVGGSTLSASAMHGGGSVGHYSGGKVSSGKISGGKFSGGKFSRGHFGPRQYGMAGHHHFIPGYCRYGSCRPGKVVVAKRNYWRYGGGYGGGYGRGYGGSCWTSVWTPSGWHRKWICGYGHPSYGRSYHTETITKHWVPGRGPWHGRR
jgi:hypothetical protein